MGISLYLSVGVTRLLICYHLMHPYTAGQFRCMHIRQTFFFHAVQDTLSTPDMLLVISDSHRTIFVKCTIESLFNDDAICIVDSSPDSKSLFSKVFVLPSQAGETFHEDRPIEP